MADIDDAPRPRALVVEPDDDIRRLLVLILRRHRFAVVEASDPTEGMAALRRRGPFDCVLVDHAPPETDGLALLRTATESDPPRVRVLMTAADIDAKLQAAVRRVGGSVLPKPFELEALSRLLLFDADPACGRSPRPGTA